MILNMNTSTPQEMLKPIKQYFDEGYRFVTATCIDEGEEYRLIYSFDKNMAMINLEITTAREKSVPSISGIYLCAFLVENEIKELFGVKIENIALDLGGKMYMTGAVKEAPMAKEFKPTVKGDE